MVIAVGHRLGSGYFGSRRRARRKPERRRKRGDRQPDKNGKNGPADASDHAVFRRQTKTVQLCGYMAANGWLRL